MISQIKNEEAVVNNVGDKCTPLPLRHYNSSKEI
jgi:hypothetical protein